MLLARARLADRSVAHLACGEEQRLQEVRHAHDAVRGAVLETVTLVLAELHEQVAPAPKVPLCVMCVIR